MSIRKLIIIVIAILNFSKIESQESIIPITTKNNALVFITDKQKRLRIIYFGSVLSTNNDYKNINNEYDFYTQFDHAVYNGAYTPAGTWNLFEPAIKVTHADGNPSLELLYDSYKKKTLDANVTETRILLKDPKYPFEVTLVFKAFNEEDVIEQWTEIKHNEKKAVILEKYASANLYFTNNSFYLTTFGSEHTKEMEPQTIKLKRGMHSVDSKLGTRNMMYQSASFALGFEKPIEEDNGKVLLGHLAWTGNFKLEFEMDAFKNVKFIGGINPYSSAFHLKPEVVFTTPKFIYTYSENGQGDASRNMHNWARKYQVLDGQGDRLTLLNNWEATYFDFNEAKLGSLIEDACDLGVDLFLLDDGWFGNKFPRNDDLQGLGDWETNKKKLPNGIGYLIRQAQKNNVKFGIWIEPEMINPKSELYQKHPEWVIKLPNRPMKTFRYQMVLDLTNPKVQDFVYNVVDDLLTEHPEIAFIKWDSNAMIYNAFSDYLDNENIPQTHLYVEHVHGFYNVLEKVRKKYPKIPMMLCSSGGSRADYKLLKYFTEFWLSDNTNPYERIFMQWEYSKFFPSIVSDSHVTKAGNFNLKYRLDVSCMGKLGFDIVPEELDERDLALVKNAIKEYDSYKQTIWQGDMFRLKDPYKNPVTSLVYVKKDKSEAVMFNYLVDFQLIKGLQAEPIKLKGLDPYKNYKIKELNLYSDKKTVLKESKIYTGDFLMKVGINPRIESDPWKENRHSVVIKFTEVN